MKKPITEKVLQILLSNPVKLKNYSAALMMCMKNITQRVVLSQCVEHDLASFISIIIVKVARPIVTRVANMFTMQICLLLLSLNSSNF